MSIKKLLNRIVAPAFDDSRDRLERSFYVIALAALLTFALSIGLIAFLQLPPLQVLIRCLIWIAIFCVVIFSFRAHRVKVAIYVGAAFLTFGLTPLNFFTSGGLASGCTIWNLFCLTCVQYVIRTRAKYFFLAANILVFASCCFIEYWYPDAVVHITRGQYFLKIFGYNLIVSVFIFVIILLQNKIFVHETETVEKQKKEIEELNVAQNRFFSNMSHEIRTPINTIIGLNEMILRERIPDEAAEDAVRMQSAGRMLLSLVNDILDMSKIESGHMEIVPAPYSTEKMLSEVANMIWFSAREKGIDFQLDIDGAIPARLVGDETRVKQILVNLLTNSVKYTPKGGVTLSVQCERAAASESAALITFSVSDTGIGIKEENIPYIFNVFRRVDLERTNYIEGTGLGLAIVKQLVDLMGGTVDVNSIYTRGSTFIVAIPQEVEGDGVIDAASIGAKGALSNSRHGAIRFTAPKARVLIVDDNEANLMVAEKLLRDTQARIDTALSGSECLRMTAEKRYDVIFMDHLMPKMDGIECLREMRRQDKGLNSETPVVALTANAGSEARALYMREGFDSVLVKPVTGRQLEDELLWHLPRELVKVLAGDAINEVLETPFHSGKRKRAVMVATDHSADIPRELARKGDIAELHATVQTEKGEFLDMVEVDQDGVLRYMHGGGKRLASVEHTVEEYSAFFAQCLSEAQHVIYLPTSSGVVRHFDTACEAARSFSSVTVFDSWHLSSGLGLLALKAEELARQGMDTDRILKELPRLRARIQTSFVVDDTRHLLDAGRLSRLGCMICDALLLHPVAVLKKGQMKIGAIKFGSGNVFWRKYISWALETPSLIDASIAFVAYVGIAEHKLSEIEAEIRARVDFERLYFVKASAAISANCGPGTFGIIFMLKR